MQVKDIIKNLKLEYIGTDESINKEVNNVFVGDLLSFVMGEGEEESVWITIQAHLNSIAVASLKDFSAIILAHDVRLEEDVEQKALEENICIMFSKESSYDIAKKLVNLGL